MGGGATPAAPPMPTPTYTQVAGTAGLLYNHPTFADYVVESWEPGSNMEKKEHMDANGETYAHTGVNPGITVNATMAVKTTKTVPVDLAVLTGTYPDLTTKKFVVHDPQEFRDGALTKFRCTLVYRGSMPNPA